MQSVNLSTRRTDQDYRSEGFYFINYGNLVECGETFNGGGHLSKLHDPLIEHREGQSLSVPLHLHAVIDNYRIEVLPLRYVLWQIVKISDLFGLLGN